MNQQPDNQFPRRPGSTPTPTPLADLPPLLPPERLPLAHQPSRLVYQPNQGSEAYDIPAIHDLPTPRVQSAPPPRKRRLRIGRVLMSLFVLMLFIAGGLGILKWLSYSHAGNSPSTTHATATAAATRSAGGNIGVPGQSLQAGADWIATVKSVHTSTDSTYPPRTGDTYLEISLSLKNTSKQAQFVASTLEFTLADTSGGQYSEAATDASNGQAVDGHLSPGQTLTGQLTYEVPQAQHHFILTFHYGLSNNTSASVTWPLLV